MELHSIIVHRLDKESQGNATITLRENLLPVGERETEFVTNIKSSLTKQIKDGLSLLDIRVSDHLIVTSKGYYSFLEGGLL